MTRNAWAFRVDPQRWIPLAGPDVLTGTARDTWVESAAVVVGLGSMGQGWEVDGLRQRCAALANAERGPESVMFVPVMEPYPVLVHMTTDTVEAITRLRERFTAQSSTTRSVDVTDLEGAGLDGAIRIARVDVDAAGHVTYTVAFAGTEGDLGTVWHATTDQPLVAGQLMSMGAEVFATVKRR